MKFLNLPKKALLLFSDTPDGTGRRNLRNIVLVNKGKKILDGSVKQIKRIAKKIFLK